MSHLSKVKTELKDFNVLKKALIKLKIDHKLVFDSNKSITKIIISQDKSNIEFVWNGKTYELHSDLNYWQQSWPIDEFLKRLKTKYTCIMLHDENERIGFVPIKQTEQTTLFERWF